MINNTPTIFLFELNDDFTRKCVSLLEHNKWNICKNDILTCTDLHTIDTTRFIGYQYNYEFNVDYFNDDVQIALSIIEKYYDNN